MPHPGIHAAARPDHPAVIMAGSGQSLTYRELDERANRLAHLFRNQGLVRGDHVALFMENQIHYMEVVWAALGSGLHITTINSYLSAPEVAYIVDNCEARVVISSRARAEVATTIDPTTTPRVERWLMTDGVVADDDSLWESYEAAVADLLSSPISDPSHGAPMLYSSGTTGRPKGVLRDLPEAPIDEPPSPRGARLVDDYDYGPDMVYLSPAPMYHAAPLVFSVAVNRLGGTLVIMERFDPAECLSAIEHYQVTHSQFVPTMFVRMLKLDAETRQGFDLSRFRIAIHAAAPCPVEVKRAMIDWWGPILHEYYAGSEGIGSTAIDSADWLEHPGSVGRARVGTIHICDEDGNDLPAGETGTVYFSGGGTFVYHNDPEKTEGARLPGGRFTLGDIGYLDPDGYLYLTDRKANMIISGGVNIYPQETEDVLITHPSVMDVAVFGVPDPDMGEQVKAVVQPVPGVDGDDALAAELISYCRDRIAAYKCPRSVDFKDELPRLPTGKLYKRLLRDHYWGSADSRIV